MSNPIDIEGTIHTARMQCMRGDREGALKNYQTVIDSISSVMGRMSPDQQLQAARTMNMYMEEAHAIQEQMARESSAASGVYDMSAAVPVPNEPPRTTPDGLASIGQAFSDIGREAQALNEKYKITETCGKVVSDVVTKTNDFLHSPEVEQRSAEIQRGIQEWDRQNHVSESIANAFNVMTETIASAFNSLVPNTVVANPNAVNPSSSAVIPNPSSSAANPNPSSSAANPNPVNVTTPNPVDAVNMSGYQPIQMNAAQPQSTNPTTTTPVIDAKDPHHFDVECCVCRTNRSSLEGLMSTEGRGKRQPCPRRSTPASRRGAPSSWRLSLAAVARRRATQIGESC